MLNKSRGNMYEFVTHTWNTIKGKCPHDCSYCYMKKWGPQKPVRFDESELKTDLGKGNFIFVGSSCDMFADSIPEEWILKTIEHCNKFPKNKYLLQTKNPYRYGYIENKLSDNFILGITIETNRFYKCMGNTPFPYERTLGFFTNIDNPKFITIEPILDFDLIPMLEIIEIVSPKWVNIGYDSGNNNLPIPSKDKIKSLINCICDSKITIKKNLQRYL